VVEIVSFWRRGLGRSAIMVVQAVLTRGMGILSSGLLARLLTATEWGAVQAVIQIAGSMTQVLKLSIDAGLQIRLSETARKPGEPTQGELLGAGLLFIGLISALAILLGVFLSETTAQLFGDAALAPYMGWAGWLAAGQLIAQLAAVLMAFGAFRTVALVQVGVSSVYLALLAGAYVLHVRGLWLGLSTQLFLQLGVALGLLVLTVRAWRARAIKPTLQRFWPAQRALIRIGLPVHAAAAVPTVLGLFLSANLARTTGLAALAEVRVVHTMFQLVAFLPASLAVTFLTEFAGARGDNAQVSHRDFLRYIRLIVASAIVAATTAAWTATWVVPLVFGAQYTSAVRLVGLGVANALVIATKQAMLTGLMSERKTGYPLADALVSSLVYAVLAALLIPTLGVAGMLLGEVLGQLTALLLLAAMLSSRFAQPDSARPALTALVTLMLTLTALGAAFVYSDRPWLYTPLLIGLSVSVPWLLFTRDERAFLIGALRRRWQRA
jgi:O-antigen/teichoic acid export membrane protein